jgi:hypothetical protein
LSNELRAGDELVVVAEPYLPTASPDRSADRPSPRDPAG